MCKQWMYISSFNMLKCLHSLLFKSISQIVLLASETCVTELAFHVDFCCSVVEDGTADWRQCIHWIGDRLCSVSELYSTFKPQTREFFCFGWDQKLVVLRFFIAKPLWNDNTRRSTLYSRLIRVKHKRLAQYLEKFALILGTMSTFGEFCGGRACARCASCARGRIPISRSRLILKSEIIMRTIFHSKRWTGHYLYWVWWRKTVK